MKATPTVRRRRPAAGPSGPPGPRRIWSVSRFIAGGRGWERTLVDRLLGRAEVYERLNRTVPERLHKQ